MTERSIVEVRPAPASTIGGLATLTPLVDPADSRFDPFLLLAHHGPQTFLPNNRGLPFDDHPHRGFETVTFVVDGALVHSDSLSERREVSAGGVQWMTAGAGIVHNEQVPPGFLEQGGGLEILQLWINLPSALKSTPPRYVGVQSSGIVHVLLEDDAGVLHLVAGTHGGREGPVRSLTGVFAGWLDIAAGSRTSLLMPAGRTILLYVIKGSIAAGGKTATRGDLLRPGSDGENLTVAAMADTVLLFAHADPIGEPVAAGGPFVMNTPAELEAAFRDYRAGVFNQPTIGGSSDDLNCEGGIDGRIG